MEGAQEFGYNQLMTTAAAEKQRYHIKNENHSENKEQQHFAVEDLLDFSNNDDDIDHIHDDYVVNDFVEDNHRHLPIDENVDNADADVGITATATTTVTGGNSADSSSITVVGRCSAENGVVLEDPKFDNDLCVPYDDLAELEWLSNFVEESFSSEDLQKLQFISGQSSGQKSSSSSQTRPTSLSDDNHPYHHHQPDLITAAATTTDYSNNNNNSSSNPTTPTQATSHSNPIIFNPELSVPARARSKRSRAAPCNWASRLLLVSPTTPPLDPVEMLATPNVVLTGAPRPNTNKSAGPKKKGAGGGGSDTTATANATTTLGSSGEGRKCLHCATDKTPQWRTGPMGPKTLCNACGVRYKSGRLVPEYRPASSPTFVLTKHSNSHRKVMELRRQKEMMRQQCQNQEVAMEEEEEEFGSYGGGGGMVFDVTNGDDYLIHQHVGPDYRQLI